MALPLTVFRTVPVPTLDPDPIVYSQCYIAPVGYSAIVLTAQALNAQELDPGITFEEPFSLQIHGTRINPLSLVPEPFIQDVVYRYQIPPTEILNASGGSAGRLVLESGDSLWAAGGANIRFTLSVLENRN